MRVAGFLVFTASATAVLAGCTRDPVEQLCPDLGPGDLVVTEVRGPQTPGDGLGEWVELYNASGATVDLRGIRIRFRRKDGSSEVPILVRRSVTVDAGGYAVLGIFDPAMLPDFADYSFATDFTESWLAAAAIDVETCGERIDVATYDALPKQGSFSFTGAMAPDPDKNDDLALWCTDPNMVGTTFPGSPQQPNLSCP
ncbi:MAG: lamin tail domain-containing protein [Deltaproteobacteria bacterium]|nr:lamin tail domain-containing protein [Deltaproteobacteria bacterium]